MTETISVLMCTWMRPEKFSGTLKMLSLQSDQNFEFCVWNNNPTIRGIIQQSVEASGWNPKFPISILDSEQNIGEIALMRMGLQARRSRAIRYVITIDDDEEFDVDMVSTFRREAAPKTISSYWAWRFTKGKRYHDREKSKPGEPAHYCGFGGTVFDADLFLDPRILNPETCFKMNGRVILMDLWVSYLAKKFLGWTLLGSAAKVWIVNDGKDQSIGLYKAKEAALNHLRSIGWEV